ANGQVREAVAVEVACKDAADGPGCRRNRPIAKCALAISQQDFHAAFGPRQRQGDIQLSIPIEIGGDGSGIVLGYDDVSCKLPSCGQLKDSGASASECAHVEAAVPQGRDSDYVQLAVAIE